MQAEKQFSGPLELVAKATAAHFACTARAIVANAARMRVLAYLQYWTFFSLSAAVLLLSVKRRRATPVQHYVRLDNTSESFRTCRYAGFCACFPSADILLSGMVPLYFFYLDHSNNIELVLLIV